MAVAWTACGWNWAGAPVGGMATVSGCASPSPGPCAGAGPSHGPCAVSPCCLFFWRTRSSTIEDDRSDMSPWLCQDDNQSQMIEGGHERGCGGGG